MSIKKVIEPESVHREGNIDKLGGIKGGEQTRHIPFLIRMRAVFICFMLLLACMLFCVGEAEAVTITVNPGESIQEAINILPEEGGIIELAEGVHEITDEMYPPGTFETGGGTVHYSIIITKSNVTITGTHDAIVRHHNKNLTCFFIPDLELIKGPDVFVENVTFKGFNTTSTYTKADWALNNIISAMHVKNLTIEDIYDTSWARTFVAPWSFQEHQRYSYGIYCKNNTIYYSDISASFAENIHVLNNTLEGPRAIIAIYRNTKYLYVVGNKVNNYGGSYACLVLESQYSEIYDNVFEGNRWGIRMTVGPSDVIVRNNTIREAREAGILFYYKYGMRNITIANNRIYNTKGHGILTTDYGYHMDGIGKAAITNNVIYSNSGDGVRMATERVNLIISSNILTNNTGYGINHLDGNITHSYNDVWGNTLDSYNNTTAGTGDISADPLFVNSANGNFHLKSTGGHWNGSAWVYDDVTSPCIDAGDPSSDYSNEPKPNGGRINIGAYGNTKEASKSPPPTITSFYPLSQVRDAAEASRTFNITLNQIVNVSWQINGTEVQKNESVTEAAYTNTSAAEGTWNVSVAVSNPRGTAIQTWIWKVGLNKQPLASYSYSPVNPVINQAITFNATNSTDPDGTIINYDWNFGDGNITNTTGPIITYSYASAGTYTVNLTITDDEDATNATTKMVNISVFGIDLSCNFDTCSRTYPSIAGTHTGTISPNQTTTVQKLYTYPSAGTGGHTEYVRLWNSTLNVTARWDGYKSDWHNVSFDVPFTLVKNETYNYTIRTGSYPQIIHNQTFMNEYGTITCTNFTDANGRVYYDWIPAIRME